MRHGSPVSLGRCARKVSEGKERIGREGKGREGKEVESDLRLLLLE
jgi:hypothetical protein